MRTIHWVAVAGIAVLLAGLLVVLHPPCSPPPREVVVYTSVDQVYSEPVLEEYGRATGVSVRAVYDVEATKTTGLANRLISEGANPRADVFWNGEVMQTILLEKRGILAPYTSPSAAGIPPAFRDPEGYWTGFGGRFRVILVNTRILSPGQYPASIDDLRDSTVPGHMVGIAYPLFGTTATHAAALYADLGGERAREYFVALRDRGVRVLDGNSVVRDKVASGELAFGLTDSDDACRAVEAGAPVAVVVPDQGPGGRGTLVIPNTVALVRGGPNPEEGKKLVDYLLSPEVEARLARDGWIQLCSRGPCPATCVDTTNLTLMNVSYDRIAEVQEDAKRELSEVFVR